MPAEDLASLALDPRQLLSEYPAGGERMAWRVRVTAAAGPDGLRALARVVAAANAAQKDAIGEGAARAAAACDGRDGAVTTRIVDWVRAAADGDVTRAFVRYLVIAPDPTASPAPVSASRATPRVGGRLDAPARDVTTPVGVEPWSPWR